MKLVPSPGLSYVRPRFCHWQPRSFRLVLHGEEWLSAFAEDEFCRHETLPCTMGSVEALSWMRYGIG